MPEHSANSARIASLDQFRGYTVAGMFLVNFVGSYAVIKSGWPLLSHHNTFCSYADTIMPQFFFAVGFAYRLTFLRRAAKDGPRAAYAHAVKRNLVLLLLAVFVHQLDGRFDSWAKLQEVGWRGVLTTAFQRNYFQTLTHIAVTSLWVMPVIAAGVRTRLLFAIGSGALFHALSEWWYYAWVLKRPGIDGGPLGFLTWTIPLIAGSWACDVMSDKARRPLPRLCIAATVLMLLGYAISCVNRLAPPNLESLVSGGQAVLVEPPFVPPTKPVNIWTMSQRAGSVSYLTFGAGFSLAIYALFVIVSDRGQVSVGFFRTLGTNALVGYMLHDLVNAALKPFVPKDSPAWYVFAGFGVSLTICYLSLRSLEKQRLFLRL